ncbi:ABC transporter permease [Oribacterium asaccharolyticum]|uniref:ABC transporter permease n=1 Tax=Oribacterium asaccharolyticum TaxID=1501332 RepID=UPI0028E54E08|nr:ABC transporter permease [Oribacterium asaccharolyticum]
MNGFLAALKKDMCLFFRKGGLFSLLFPLLLLPLFLFFFRGSSGGLQAFPVSVIDEDETLMSKTLIRQMEEVELFSEVHKISREDISEELEKGSVGVLRIPKDFFYTAYRFQGEPVELILNERRATESAILESVFTSIMKIMEKEQEMSLAVFHTAYGEKLSASEEEELYHRASERLLNSVLKRQLIFQNEEVGANVAFALVMRIASALLFLFLSFISLSMVSAVPEEEKKGIVSRFRQMGGRGFYLSKFLLLFLLALPVLALSLLFLYRAFALPPELLLFFSLYYNLSLISFYLFFWGIFSLVREERLAKNFSVCLIFLLLLFTGRLFSAGRLPFSLARFSPISINAVLLEGLRRGYSPARLMPFVLPLGLFLLLGMLLRFMHSFMEKRSPLEKERVSEKRSPLGKQFLMHCLPFPVWRGYILLGRTVGVLLFLLFCLCLGRYAEDKTQEKIAVYLVNEDGGEWSQELIRDMKAEKSLEIRLIPEREKEEKLLYGDKEGVLTIRKGYTGDREEKGKLLYESGSASLSEMGLREIVAAVVAGEKIERGANDYLSSLLGREIRADEQDLLTKNQKKYKRTSPLYTVRKQNGATREELFSPRREAVYAFLLYFFLFSLASVAGEGEEKRVGARLQSIAGASRRYLIGLFLVFLGISLCFFFALRLDFSFNAMLSLLSYTLFLFGFSRFLSVRVLGEGAETGLSLNLGLFFCLSGGAFMDFTALSGWIKYLPYLSPVGLFLKGTEGNLLASAILLVIGLCTCRSSYDRPMRRLFFL